MESDIELLFMQAMTNVLILASDLGIKAEHREKAERLLEMSSEIGRMLEATFPLEYPTKGT